MNTIQRIATGTFLPLFPIGLSGQSAARLTGLQNDYLDHPISMDHPSPRLSWRMEDDRRGATQQTYRVWVGKDSAEVAGGHADMWNTGLVRSSQMLVAYQGKPLSPFTKYFWPLISTRHFIP